ncbi:MAG: DNA polymerase IV [Lachnospiraceae bacterium]|nr:DNA polymerase IV [Lachnospiraceae bacterium]
MERIIFHIDVNSAFLSWEACENLKNGGTEDYREELAAVGGDIERRHGIILAKSILTKPYGVTTGEPIVNALRKCPGLKIIPPHHSLYHGYSAKFIAILKQYSEKVEQFSIDEAFVDMTGTELLFGKPAEAADRIREQIRRELGFTVNVGVANCKLCAKMASDFQKPDRTHTLFQSEIPSKMWPLPVGDLFFVGKNTASKLHSLGIRTIGDLAHYDRNTLKRILGKAGEGLWQSANGIDESEVESIRPDAKGYSNETTTPYNITDPGEAREILRELTEKVASRLRHDGVRIETVGVILKYADFSRASHQVTMTAPTNITSELYEKVCRLFQEIWDGRPIRLVGVQTTKIASPDAGRQLSLFDTTDYEKLEKLDSALDEINDRFGKGSVVRASNASFKQPKIP